MRKYLTILFICLLTKFSFAQSNMLTWSEDLTKSGVWIQSNVTVTADQKVDVNGQQTIDMITASSSSYNVHEVVSVTAGTQYTFSFYAERGTMTDVKYSVYNATASSNIVNPTSYYSLVNSTGITRVNVTFTAPAGCTSVWVYPGRDGGSTGTVYVGDLQMVPGSSPGTYTKTTSTPVLPNPPSVSTSGNQNISATSTTIYSVPSAGSGHTITGYLWTKVSGGAATITNPTSQNTDITGLDNGTYVFNIKVTQDDGQTANANVTVTVSGIIVTYYISNDGNDANDGKSPSTAWQTLSKVNSTTFSAGNQILLNRGDVFYGSLVITYSGTAGSPITFGAYGTGANPVITGFTTVSGWTNLGGNIWESTNAVSSLTTCNVVSINGVNTPMGRFPNTGWKTITGSTLNSITDNTLDATDWTGADVVTRTFHYVIDKWNITSESSKTLNYTNDADHVPVVGWGYFIQNSLKTLDQQNEWYYNSTTKKLDVYSTSQPSNVQLSTVDVIVDLHNKNYITFDGLDFEGANTKVFFLGSSKNIIMQNCDFNNTGWTAIYGEIFGVTADNLTIQNCSFNHNPQGIKLDNQFIYAHITNNTFTNTGLVYGSWQNEQYQACAIYTKGDYTVIEGNRIDSTGFAGVAFTGNYDTVRHNFITNSTMSLEDCGGIYTIGYPRGTGKSIYNNIVLDSHGNSSGTTDEVIAYGIYTDDYSNGVEIGNNTIAHCASGGIYIHLTDSAYIHNNTCFDNGYKESNGLSNGEIGLDGDDQYLRNARIFSNIFASKTVDQRTATFRSTTGNYISSFGVMDSNYYARPIDADSIIDAVHDGNDHFMTLAQWQTFSGQDAHAKNSPKTIIDVNDLRFEYNATSSPKTITLDAKYLDPTNIAYNSGSIILQPFSSAVLINNGALDITNPPDALIKLRIPIKTIQH